MRNPIHVARLFASLARLTGDLRRLDRVFEINDILMTMRSSGDSRLVLECFRSSPSGAEALRARPRLGRLDLGALAASSPQSLGGAYGRFLLKRGLTPESLPDVEVRTDVDYVLAHLYETHDLWHVVTGFDVDAAGEAAIQAFYLAQMRAYLPFFVLSAILLNTVLFAYEEKQRRLDAIAEGWLLGKQAQRLAGIDWKKHFDRPLLDVRRELDLLPRGLRAQGAVS